MLLQEKKKLIFWLLVVGLLITIFFWHPSETGRAILRYMLIGNIIFILVMSGILHFFFWYRYRTIIKMLQYVAQVYDTPLAYSYTPVTLIKKRLQDKTQKSYLKNTNQRKDRYSFTIVHNKQDYDFIHHLPTNNSHDWASVLIYYLQQDIPYEILYEQSKYIHTTLAKK